MHIAVLCDPCNFHTQKWTKGLLATGVKVTVFSFWEGELPGAECVRIAPAYAPGGRITYASYLQSGERLARELKARQVDLLNPINITPFGVWGHRSGFRPLVNVAMGADILEYPPEQDQLAFPEARLWESNNPKSPMGLRKLVLDRKWAFFRRQVQAALDASDLITGDNRVLTQAMQQWFGVPKKKVKLHRWGIEPELFETSEDERRALRQQYGVRDWQRVVLSPRGMKPIYQGDRILEAFSLLLKAGVRDLKFIMLSAGYDIPPEVDTRARTLASQFENFYYVPGLLPREAVIKLWTLTDAFVNAPVYDGFSNALSEGRYVGAIPFYNDIPAHREVMRDGQNGRLVDPFTPELLADTLRETMENYDSWHERFAANNRAWILQNAHLETNMQRFVRACEQVLKKHR